MWPTCMCVCVRVCARDGGKQQVDGLDDTLLTLVDVVVAHLHLRVRVFVCVRVCVRVMEANSR